MDETNSLVMKRFRKTYTSISNLLVELHIRNKEIDQDEIKRVSGGLSALENHVHLRRNEQGKLIPILDPLHEFLEKQSNAKKPFSDTSAIRRAFHSFIVELEKEDITIWF